MTDLRITTTRGTDTALDEATVQEFKASVRGQLIRPGDAGYDDARKIFNGMIDRHPALIVRCAGVADVIAAVNFARGYDLLMAVRGGGHSAPGFSMCDGGLVVDLSAMRSVRVDPATADCARRGRCHLGRFRPRDAGLWLGLHGWHRLIHRNRWTHTGGRAWLSEPQIRPGLRQPDLG